MLQSLGQVIAGRDTSGEAVTLKVDSTGQLYIVGSGSSGSVYGTGTIGLAPPQAPVNIGVVDDAGLLRNAKSDSVGHIQTVGVAANGSAVSGAPVLMAGYDGANVRSFLTDTAGRTIAVGAAANGSAIVGNPVMTGGSDGTNARVFRTDANGNQEVVGSTPSGATASPNPILIAGHDGTHVQNIHTDASGNLYTITAPGAGGIVFGPSPTGSPPADPPVLTAGWDGTNTHTLLTDVTGALVTRPAEPVTYACGIFNQNIIGGGGAPILVLQGSATKTIRITSVSISAITSGTARDMVFGFARSTAPSGGTSAPLGSGSHDSSSPPATAVATVFSAMGAAVTAQAVFASGGGMIGSPTVAPTLFSKSFGYNVAQLPTLRGTSQYFSVIVYTGLDSTTTFQVYLEWTEE